MKALLVAAFAVSTSLGCQPAPPVVHPSWTSQVQAEITRHITVRDPDKVRSLIPYQSISIERTPCFGKCPVYKMTFHRDGKALLVDDHLRPDEARHYSAEIDLKQYARIAQFAEIARRAMGKEEYMGQWTDDYSLRITATHSNGSWTVLDYGQVTPPELWALEQVLLRQYDTFPGRAGLDRRRTSPIDPGIDCLGGIRTSGAIGSQRRAADIAAINGSSTKCCSSSSPA